MEFGSQVSSWLELMYSNSCQPPNPIEALFREASSLMVCVPQRSVCMVYLETWKIFWSKYRYCIRAHILYRGDCNAQWLRVTHMCQCLRSWMIYLYVWYKIELGYKPVYGHLVCSQLSTAHYMTSHKTIYMYYLNKSHDLLNRSCN